MQKDGFPRGEGLSENNFLVRRHNEKTAELNELWWELVQETTRRDQVSFQYCIWKTGAKAVYIAPDTIQILHHKSGKREIE